MRRLAIPVIFFFLSSNLSNISVFCAEQADRQAEIEVWKQQVSQRGTGERSKWEAQLLDGRKIRGYASEIQQEGFALVDEKTGGSFDISYSELKSLKPRVGMSKWAKAAIIGGAVYGALWALFAATKPWD